MADEEKVDPSEGSDDHGDLSSTGATAYEADSDQPGPDGVQAQSSEGDSRELIGVGAREGKARGARQGGSSALSSTDLRPKNGSKDKATAKRGAGAPEHPRTGPLTFVRESVGELRKVVYPTGQQLLNYFIVVLVFVLFIIAFVSLLDLAFGAAIFKVFS